MAAWSAIGRDKSATSWVGSWAASPESQLANATPFENQTLREIVHTSIGGHRVRVRISNALGAQPLTVGAARIGIRSSESGIVQGSDRVLQFGGQASVSVPPGALLLSDPVDLDVPPLSDVAISLFLPNATPPETVHWSALQTSYVATGDLTSAASFPPDATKITSWPFLTAVDVEGSESSGAIVTLGDSITDGAHSTTDTNSRWPDILARRLIEKDRRHPLAVLNEGIGGNRILHDGRGPRGPSFGPSTLARFDRDVLAQAGVKYVIVLEGINDIGHAGTSAPASEEVSAEDIIAGLRQIIARAHEKGLRVFGGTLTPFEGTTIAGYYSPQRDTKRQAVNQWIRTGGAFDGVIDFEKAVRDPDNPTRMLAKYDSGDHLHPGDAGYKAMGEAIDLNLFR